MKKQVISNITLTMLQNAHVSVYLLYPPPGHSRVCTYSVDVISQRQSHQMSGTQLSTEWGRSS